MSAWGSSNFLGISIGAWPSAADLAGQADAAATEAERQATDPGPLGIRRPRLTSQAAQRLREEQPGAWLARVNEERHASQLPAVTFGHFDPRTVPALYGSRPTYYATFTDAGRLLEWSGPYVPGGPWYKVEGERVDAATYTRAPAVDAADRTARYEELEQALRDEAEAEVERMNAIQAEAERIERADRRREAVAEAAAILTVDPAELQPHAGELHPDQIRAIAQLLASGEQPELAERETGDEHYRPAKARELYEQRRADFAAFTEAAQRATRAGG